MTSVGRIHARRHVAIARVVVKFTSVASVDKGLGELGGLEGWD